MRHHPKLLGIVVPCLAALGVAACGRSQRGTMHDGYAGRATDDYGSAAVPDQPAAFPQPYVPQPYVPQTDPAFEAQIRQQQLEAYREQVNHEMESIRQGNPYMQ